MSGREEKVEERINNSLEKFYWEGEKKSVTNYREADLTRVDFFLKMGCTRAYLYAKRDAPAERGSLKTDGRDEDHRSSKVW